MCRSHASSVVPAQTGTQRRGTLACNDPSRWIPAFAGMTNARYSCILETTSSSTPHPSSPRRRGAGVVAGRSEGSYRRRWIPAFAGMRLSVVPAQAGTQVSLHGRFGALKPRRWIPAFAGMTDAQVFMHSGNNVAKLLHA